VSIGVGFKCLDGIVLCADNQITYPANHKYYERKIYSHTIGTLEGAVAFTFAGNPNLMKMFNGKFQAGLGLIPKPYTADKIHTLIETLLDQMDILDSDPDGLHLLCAIGTPSGMKLLKSDRKAIGDVTGFEYVGVGDSSVLRYLSPLLIRRPTLRINEAMNIGIYLVLQAKRYVDGCGGETDAISITDRAIVTNTAGTYNVEQILLQMEHAIGQVANAFFDSDKTDEEVQQFIDRLAGKMKDHRPTFTQRWRLR
jgi:hypothetical protein